jgi:hypothetical protein
VHGQVGAVLAQGIFDLGDEQALATDLGERTICTSSTSSPG